MPSFVCSGMVFDIRPYRMYIQSDGNVYLDFVTDFSS